MLLLVRRLGRVELAGQHPQTRQKSPRCHTSFLGRRSGWVEQTQEQKREGEPHAAMVRLGGWSRRRSSPIPRALEGKGLQEAWRPPSPLLTYWIFPTVLSMPSVCCSLTKPHTLGHMRHRLDFCPGSLDLECHTQSPRERHWRKMKRKPPANTEVSFPNHRFGKSCKSCKGKFQILRKPPGGAKSLPRPKILQPGRGCLQFPSLDSTNSILLLSCSSDLSLQERPQISNSDWGSPSLPNNSFQCPVHRWAQLTIPSNHPFLLHPGYQLCTLWNLLCAVC